MNDNSFAQEQYTKNKRYAEEIVREYPYQILLDPLDATPDDFYRATGAIGFEALSLNGFTLWLFKTAPEYETFIKWTHNHRLKLIEN